MAIDLRPVTRSKTVQVFHHTLPQAGLSSETALKQFARLCHDRRSGSRSGWGTQGLQARERPRRFLSLASLQEASPLCKRGQPGIAGCHYRPVPPTATAGTAAAAASLATAWSNASTMGRNTRSASSMYWADMAPTARVRRATTKL